MADPLSGRLKVANDELMKNKKDMGRAGCRCQEDRGPERAGEGLRGPERA